jgi:hypothetical protein
LPRRAGRRKGVDTVYITDPFTIAAESASLVLIVASFLIVTYLAYRVKTFKSLQFEMFVVLLVITSSEIPEILSDLDIISISGIETTGLLIHSIAMVFLAGFIAMRVARYLKQ